MLNTPLNLHYKIRFPSKATISNYFQYHKNDFKITTKEEETVNFFKIIGKRKVDMQYSLG